MGCRLAAATLLLVALITGVATSRQPSIPPVSYPPINPAQARLDGVLGGLDGPGFAITYVPASGTLWAACEEQTLCGWNPDAVLGFRTGDTPAFQVPKAHEGPILALTSIDQQIASAGSDGKIVLWNLRTGLSIPPIVTGTVIRALAFAENGKTIVGVGDNGRVQAWDTNTAKAGQQWQASEDWLLAVAVSPDGKAVATGGLDGKLRIWELVTGKKRIEANVQVPSQPNQPMNATTQIASLAFAPDGKSILAGGQDGLIYHFGFDGKFVRVLTGHTSTVTGMVFHPAGQVLVSGAKDRTVRLWNPTTGQAIKTLEGHQAWVMGVALAAQGTRVASVSADHTVRVWDLTEPTKK